MKTFHIYTDASSKDTSIFPQGVKRTNPWKSSITGEIYQGFVIQENDKGLMRAIIKKDK